MCLKTRNKKTYFEFLEGSDPKTSTEDMDEEMEQRREIRKAGVPNGYGFMDPKTRNGNGTKRGSRGSLMETGSGGAGGTLRCPTLTMSPLIHLGKVKIFRPDQYSPKVKIFA